MVTAMQKYVSVGDIDEIDELKNRIVKTYKSMFPGSEELTDDEAFALAQVGHLQGLDVFNKEIYYLKQVNTDYQTGQKIVKSVGVMPGIRGLRKHAHRQIRYEGGRSASYFMQFVRVDDPQEKEILGGGPHDIVTKCIIRDSVTMGNYLNMRKSVFGNDRSWTDLLKLSREDGSAQATVQKAIEDTAAEILGPAPVFVGVGIVKNAELKKDGQNLVRPLTMRSGQGAYYMSEIRAERRALYKRFDLEKKFGAIVDDVESEIESMDASIEASEDDVIESTSEQPRTVEENVKQLGFS